MIMVDLLDCTKIKDNNLAGGSKGEMVSLLQTHLKKLGYYTKDKGVELKIDGDFGPFTEQAVIDFQTAMGDQYASGSVGEKTCKQINNKISPQSSGTSASSTSTTTTPTNTTKVTKVVNPYPANPNKNVLKVEEANLSIDGLFFIISNITPSNAFHGGNWKTLDLMEGRKDYAGSDEPYEYSLDCYLSNENFEKLLGELDKIGKRDCKVISTQIRSGTYKIAVSYANEKLSHKKITFKLKETGEA